MAAFTSKLPTYPNVHRLLPSLPYSSSVAFQGRVLFSNASPHIRHRQCQRRVNTCSGSWRIYGSANLSDDIPPVAGATGDDPLVAEIDDVDFEPARMKRLLTEIVTFSLPVLMVPLADPVMSLIDTVALGQMAGTLQLAALGPCSLIFNFAFYSFNALSIATVSLTAERLRQGRGAGTSLSTALFVGAVGGTIITAIIQGWGPQLLEATGCDPSLLTESWKYLKIRSLAAPAAILTQVAQAGLLGQRDSKTPFKVVLTSIVISLLGDILLIGGLGLGVAGAAWTTVAAQCLSAVVLIRALRHSKVVPPIQFPEFKELKALLTIASTLGIFYVATKLPTMLLAAHMPVWQTWGLCSFTNTPLEQAALAFLPAAKTRRDRKELTTLLLGLGVCMGIACSLVAHGVPALAPGLLAADSALWPLMQSVWLPGTLAMLCCGADVSATGILLASKDVGYVARAMLISLGVLASFLWGISASSGPFIGGVEGLGVVWWSLAVFFLARVVQSVPRVFFSHFLESDGSARDAPDAAAAGPLNAKAA